MKQVLANQTQLAADIKKQQAAHRSLELQLAQLQQALNTRPQGDFPSNKKIQNKLW